MVYKKDKRITKPKKDETMKSVKLTFLTIASIVTMTMCSCVAYRPQVSQIPLIHEKGELQVNGSIGLSAPLGDGYLGATATYGATDWLAVQAHVNWTGDKGAFGQASVGAYKAWKKAVLEGYVGYGFGGNRWESNSSDENTHIVTSRFHLPFGQLNFGWAGLANGHIDIGIGLKGGCIFPDIYDEKIYANSGQIQIRTNKDPIGLLEPQFFFRAGGKHLKWTLDIGYSQLWSTSADKEVFSGTSAVYMPFTITTGLTYDFNVFEKKGK